jgi:competence protein ComEC
MELRKLSDALASELENFFLWLPVFLAIGILIFFALPYDPSPYLSFFTIFLSLALFIISRRHYKLHYIALALMTVLIGFTATMIRVELVKAPILRETLEKIWLEGDVCEINNTEDGQKLILENLLFKGYNGVMPKKVRLSLRHTQVKIDIGNHIGVKAVLMAPPSPSLPRGFDYQLYAYFKQIGAIGYAVGKVKILKNKNKLSTVNNFFANLRQKVEDRLFSEMTKPASAIAVGILVGDASAISGGDFDDIRKAGLAHIIAISGMHIVVVVGLIFISVRFLLARFEILLLKFDVKKIAALSAILGSFVYLKIAGSPLSAQRAFIMSTLVLTAIVLDRNVNPMRSIAIAALIILCFTPEAILSASLQMSFAASMALIASFAITQEYLKFSNQSSLFIRILSYFLTITISTLVAGLATAPFIIYHFNQFSTYSVLSNLIAIPLSDFIIMPAGMLAMLLMPLGIEKIALYPMQWGIEFMLWISHTVANLPHSSYYVPSILPLGLISVSIGGLILCFFSTKLRYLGIIPICLGMTGIWHHEKLDVIISQDGKLFAVEDDIGVLAFSSKASSRFNRKIWQQSRGENFIFSLKEAYLDKCRYNYCFLERNNHKVMIVGKPHDPAKHCGKYDIYINLVDNIFHCAKANLSINLNNLNQDGAHTFRLSSEKIRVEKVSDFRPKRIWNE